MGVVNVQELRIVVVVVGGGGWGGVVGKAVWQKLTDTWLMVGVGRWGWGGGREGNIC